MINKENNIIFAMRNSFNSIVLQIQNLLTNNKGTVSHSYSSNAISLFRNFRGLYPHFINLTNFLMRNRENKVNGNLLLTTSQNYISKITALFPFVNSKKLAI